MSAEQGTAFGSVEADTENFAIRPLQNGFGTKPWRGFSANEGRAPTGALPKISYSSGGRLEHSL